MARTALIVKASRKPKFSTRKINRCWRCGRNHGYMNDFKLCRICFRELADNGDLLGIRKSSW